MRFEILKAGLRSAGRAERGFTLVELMVTVVVLAVLIAIGMPAMNGLINSNRLTTQSNELVGAIQMARSEAIKRNAPVSMCGSLDGLTCAAAGNWTHWLVVLDSDDSVLQAGEIRPPAEVNSATPRITFHSDGLARTAAGLLFAGDVAVCLPVTRPEQNLRRVAVVSGSRTSITSANNGGECP
ncbi:hypothetical protein ABB27_13805 [Stenotrophomonas terrae]|uniref:Type II secretion system protein H n=1 Tax=Stenotrophomonas terrae TaxID=405446 RepID=A0A0R0CA41_9GAMM|nr:GspH/FimT family pseudopilin [Stenotrophomonas terrae]KRG66444.1 hypothetical protein ABB27_13805 [Stenotrophomonas terrae]